MKKFCSLEGIQRSLFLAIALSGVVFALLLLAASISVIGFEFYRAFQYGSAVLFVWFLFEVLGRFGGDWCVKREPFLIILFFFLAYLALIRFVPELGQLMMPYDSLRAQKSLESGHFAFFRPLKFYYWINYDFVLSALGMLFSPKLIVGQVFNAVCRALALYPIFKLSERVSGRRMARFVTVLAGLSPALSLYATTLVGDFTSAMFYLYAVYFFLSVPNWNAASVNNISFWILVGLFAGMGYLFKTISFLYFAAFMVWMIFKGLECRRAKMVLLLVVSFLVIVFSHGTVKFARSVVYNLLRTGSKVQVAQNEDFMSGILYEIYLGMCIQTGGGYSSVRDKAFRPVPMEKKLEMVKDMFVKDMDKYPRFVVDKFRAVWGTNDSPGSIFYWFKMSCQKDCYNSRDRNYCVPWLVPLLRAEYLFFALMFLFGTVGFALSWRKNLNFNGMGVVSLVIVLLFAMMSMLIESHGRYRTAIYPFFFFIMPYCRIWFDARNPLEMDSQRDACS